jgi:DNA polymerase elongation subunit (family B)
MTMTPEQHERLIKKTQATKQAIEEIKKQAAQRKLDARRKIEDIKIDKELGLAYWITKQFSQWLAFAAQ